MHVYHSVTWVVNMYLLLYSMLVRADFEDFAGKSEHKRSPELVAKIP